MLSKTAPAECKQHTNQDSTQIKTAHKSRQQHTNQDSTQIKTAHKSRDECCNRTSFCVWFKATQKHTFELWKLYLLKLLQHLHHWWKDQKTRFTFCESGLLSEWLLSEGLLWECLLWECLLWECLLSECLLWECLLSECLLSEFWSFGLWKENSGLLVFGKTRFTEGFSGPLWFMKCQSPVHENGVLCTEVSQWEQTFVHTELCRKCTKVSAHGTPVYSCGNLSENWGTPVKTYKLWGLQWKLENL